MDSADERETGVLSLRQKGRGSEHAIYTYICIIQIHIYV